jgi:hypothetical protein
MDSKTSDKLRELAKALLAGKGNRKEIATALANGADRIEKLERLRGAMEQEAWSKFFGDCISGYLADPLVDLDEGDELERMLRQCHRVAERGLVYWRHRWAGGPSPYPTKRREHMSREELDRLPPPSEIEASDKVQAHVAGVHEAMSALDEKDRTVKRRRQREELAEIKPLPVRKRPPDESAGSDFADPNAVPASAVDDLPIPEHEDDEPTAAEAPAKEASAVAKEAPAAPATPEATPTAEPEKSSGKGEQEFVEGAEGSWND